MPIAALEEQVVVGQAPGLHHAKAPSVTAEVTKHLQMLRSDDGLVLVDAIVKTHSAVRGVLQFVQRLMMHFH